MHAADPVGGARGRPRACELLGGHRRAGGGVGRAAEDGWLLTLQQATEQVDAEDTQGDRLDSAGGPLLTAQGIGLLPATCYLRPATCYLLPVTCDLLPVTCHLLPSGDTGVHPG